jgi:hypothetical protein
MSLYTRVCNAVSEAEKHVPYVELIGTIVSDAITKMSLKPMSL